MPNAVKNHLHFCMMATSVVYIYASRLDKTPNRRHVVKGRNHFAFSDVRRSVAKAALDDNFGILFPAPRKSVLKSLDGANAPDGSVSRCIGNFSSVLKKTYKYHILMVSKPYLTRWGCKCCFNVDEKFFKFY